MSSHNSIHRRAITRSLSSVTRQPLENQPFILPSRQNSMICSGPIAQLPNELLAEIFQHLRTESPTELAGWTPVLQVCKHWNEVTIGFSPLWAYIQSDYPRRFVRDSLVRSGGASLDIVLTAGVDPTKRDLIKFIDILAPHEDRIGTFSATFDRGSLYTDLLPKFKPLVSKARKITLELATNPSRKSTFPLGACLAAKAAKLTNIYIIVEIPIKLPQLTSLSLEHGQAGLPPLETLADVLEATPLLQHLQLTGGQSNEPGKTASELIDERIDRFPLHMEHLKTLVFCMSPESSREVLSLVSTPANTNVALCLPVISHGGVMEGYMSSAFPEKRFLGNLRCISDTAYLVIRVHNDKPQIAGFGLVKHAGGWSYVPTFTVVIPEVTYPKGEKPNQKVVNAFVGLIKHLGIGERISGVEFRGSDEWHLDLTNLLRQLTHLKGLNVAVPCLESVMSALSATFNDGEEGEEKRHVICPRLGHLRLINIPFDASAIKKMVECLKGRKEKRGKTLDTLEIEEPTGMLPEYLEMLEDVVCALRCSPHPGYVEQRDTI